jgi:hypothetical protein
MNFSAIAVGKWGNIHECHQLEDRFDKVIIYITISILLSATFVYRISVQYYCFRNSNNQSTVRKGYGQYKLESNHTHYIFFDDGTCNSLNTGEFASNLARQISRGARRRSQYFTHLCFRYSCDC